MLEEKPIKINNVSSIEWAPCTMQFEEGPLLAVHCIPSDYSLASLTIFRIPSRVQILTKTYLNVARAKLVWQNGHTNLDYLSVLTQHYSKLKPILPGQEDKGNNSCYYLPKYFILIWCMGRGSKVWTTLLEN